MRRSPPGWQMQRLRNEAAAAPSVDDAEWCRAQILDLLAAWEAADDGQRSRLLASLFESIEAEAFPDRDSSSPPYRAADGSTSFR
jgi:hypothetical protein